jgi:hypothetical protein
MNDKSRDDIFGEALNAALDELVELETQERNIASRKADLRQTVSALWPVVVKQPLTDINTLSLPDAMRLVLRSAGRALNAHDYRAKLLDLGFELSKFDNPMANIQTAMKRMVDSGEMCWVEGEAKKVLPGEKLKPVEEPADLSADELRAMLDGLMSGLNGEIDPVEIDPVDVEELPEEEEQEGA